MSAMLIFQAISMGRFISYNNQRWREYISTANGNIAASLNTMGENIRSMAFYIASFESFKSLYFPDRSAIPDTASMVSSVFHSVRFISTYYPIIKDVAVVGLNALPFSYYLGYGYGFMELMRNDYEFDDPYAMESKFFYFSGQDYFVYVTPISSTFSTTGNSKKIASCIFICDLNYIRELVDIYTGDEMVNFSVYDESGRIIVSGGHEENNNTNIEIRSTAENMGLTIVAAWDTVGIAEKNNITIRFIGDFFVFSSILLVAITVVVIILLRIKIAHPISGLVDSMGSIGNKPLHKRLNRSHIDEIDHIVEGVNALLDEIADYTQKSLASQRKLYEMELQKNAAEIYALQSQINPHFLNNTLQCIRGIAISRGINEIADISLGMSELFRYAMNYGDRVKTREEIYIIQQYITIIKIRFQNRFDFSFDIAPETLDIEICRMVLQPLVENAVHHGVTKREDGGLVELTGTTDGEIARFEVIDNGPGFEENRLEDIRRELGYSFLENRGLRKGASFGLYNINRRLKLEYGETYGLEIERRDGKTLVRISFPVILSKIT
jgi:sensor histidine kinase YesM